MKKRYTQHAIFPFNRCSCGNVATHCEFEKDATNRGDDVLVNSWCEVCYKTQPQLTPNSMSNTKKSVEEIVEEFGNIFWDIIGTETDPHGTPNMYLIRDEFDNVENGIDFSPELNAIKEWLTQTLQTERQKREEVVEEAEAREKQLKTIHTMELDAVSCMSIENFVVWRDYRKQRPAQTN